MRRYQLEGLVLCVAMILLHDHTTHAFSSVVHVPLCHRQRIIGRTTPQFPVSNGCFLSSASSSSPESRDESYRLPVSDFIDSKTNCQVVLLGCFHGTASSAADVKQVITPETDVVVLELCAARFKDLRDEIREEEEEEAGGARKVPWLTAYVQTIQRTVKLDGWSSGLAMAVLAGFSTVQSNLSGFTSGIEFRTAIDQAYEYDADIILADQHVDETLHRLGTLPAISWDILKSDDRWDEWNTHSSTLRRALLGDSNKSDENQVNLGGFLFRNTLAIQDMFRFLLSPVLAFAIFNQIFGYDEAMLLESGEYVSAMDTVNQLLLGAVVLVGNFYLLTLPTVKVILSDRDEILTKGIEKACERAGSGGRVVAVLGLLHVNGIAKRMTQASSSTTTTTTPTTTTTT